MLGHAAPAVICVAVMGYGWAADISTSKVARWPKLQLVQLQRTSETQTAGGRSLETDDRHSQLRCSGARIVVIDTEQLLRGAARLMKAGNPYGAIDPLRKVLAEDP